MLYFLKHILLLNDKNKVEFKVNLKSFLKITPNTFLLTWWHQNKKVWLDVVSFYSISSIVSYLMPNPLLYIKQFYFKQFSLA